MFRIILEQIHTEGRLRQSCWLCMAIFGFGQELLDHMMRIHPREYQREALFFSGGKVFISPSTQ